MVPVNVIVKSLVNLPVNLPITYLYVLIDRSPGAMWVCVFPVSVGTMKITGVTPSTTCTGE